MLPRNREDSLETEVAMLREVIKKVSGEGQFHFPRNWRLSQNSYDLLSLLTVRGFVSYDAAYEALYWRAVEPPFPSAVNAALYQLRKRVEGRVNIQTVRGRGFQISHADQQFLARFKIPARAARQATGGGLTL